MTDDSFNLKQGLASHHAEQAFVSYKRRERGSELVADGGEVPAAALGDETGGDAALFVVVVEDVLDVDVEGEVAPLVGCTEVEEHAGIDFLEDGGLALDSGGFLVVVINLRLVFGGRVEGILFLGLGQHGVVGTEDAILQDVEIEDMLAALEVDVGAQLQVLGGLPCEDGIGSEVGGAERVAEGDVEEFGSADSLPRGIDVGGKWTVLVVGRELDAIGVVVAGVVVFGDVLVDEVAGNVVEPVELDVQSGEPLAGSEGELEGVKCLGHQDIAVFFVGPHIIGHDEVGLTIQVGGVDE